MKKLNTAQAIVALSYSIGDDETKAIDWHKLAQELKGNRRITPDIYDFADNSSVYITQANFPLEFIG